MSTLNGSVGDQDCIPRSAVGGSATIHDAGQRRSILVAVCVALMAVIAVVTGLNVAQPPLVLGPLIRTDENKMISVTGIYAVGDIARAPHSISWAVADGVTAGTAVHRALLFG